MAVDNGRGCDAAMKFIEPHLLADADAAARKVIEIANGVETVQDGRIFIECVERPSSIRSGR
jgi:hypothetical protein